MNKRVNAVHVGISGFPFGSAAINKCLAVYEVLWGGDVDVLVINNRARHQKGLPIEINKKGKYKNIKYCYTTPTPFKPKKFIDKRYYNFIGRVKEFFLLVKLALKGEIDIMFFYPEANFFELLYYRVFSKLFRIPLVSHYVEYRTAFSNKRRLWIKINDSLFDKYFMRFVDGVLPISEYLIKHMKKSGYNKPYIKIPPLVDFEIIEKHIEQQSTKKYFLYNGSLGYSDAIDLILESFNLVNDDRFYLYMVLNGSLDDMKVFKEKLNMHPKKKRIKIFSKLEYKVLLELLYDAKALLVPLNDSIKDKARFPQKIAEYSATGNPIISTNYGEVKKYFKDEENALIADSFSSVLIAGKMNFVIKNASLSKIIGQKGYETGLKFFDANSYKVNLREFVLNIIKKNK